MLETQLGQLASASNSREIGNLPSQPQNPRKHCNAIVTRSDKQLGEHVGKVENEIDKESKQKEVEKLGKKDSLKKKGDESVQEAPKKRVSSKTYTIPLPFPPRYQKAKLDKQLGKFLDVFK